MTLPPFRLLLTAFAIIASAVSSPAAPPKPRIVVLTDVSTWETDDHESLIRLLVHADLLEIEGLVFTTGWSIDNAIEHKRFLDIIHGVIDAYEKDLPHLLKRSGQTGFADDEGRQEIGYWPSPDYLRSRTMMGSAHRGMKFIGAENNSPGSDLIIAQADELDERPVWVQLWGGGNTLAQAIWQVQQTRSEAALKAFLKKIPAYAITDQDRHYNGSEGHDISSHQWMRRTFADDLLFIWDEQAWRYQNGTGKAHWDDYATNIQGHGALGQQYPKYKFGVEGDTPAFLHTLPNGLNDPMDPTQAGWGGYSARGPGPDGEPGIYSNHDGDAKAACIRYVGAFYPAIFNNFAARMDWAQNGAGNRNPSVAIDADVGIAILTRAPRAGTTVTLDASASSDPDGDALTFNWWLQPEAGSYAGVVALDQANTPTVRVDVPADSAGKPFHLICEVTDQGSPALTSYRRIIFNPVH